MWVWTTRTGGAPLGISFLHTATHLKCLKFTHSIRGRASFLHYDNPRFLHLQIDLAVPIKNIISGLRSILKERQNDLVTHPDLLLEQGPTKGFYFAPRYASRRSPIRDLKAWLLYLKCYDLLHLKALSYGKIAQKVYDKGGDKAYEQAERACNRVEQLIHATESHNWPPELT